MPQLAAAASLHYPNLVLITSNPSSHICSIKCQSPVVCIFPPGLCWGTGIWFFLIPFTSTFAAQNVTRGMHIPLALLGGGAGIWFFNTRHLHIYATKCLLWYIPCVLSGYLIVLTLLTSTFAAQNVTHGMHIPWCRGGYLIVVIPVTSTFTAHDVTGSIFPFVLGGYFFDTRHPPP